MLMHGFTVGIGDCIANRATVLDIQKIISDSMRSVDGLIEKARSGAFDKEPGMTLRESVEARVRDAGLGTINKFITPFIRSTPNSVQPVKRPAKQLCFRSSVTTTSSR